MTYAMRLNGGALVTAGKEVAYAGDGTNGWKADVISDGTGFGNPETLSRTLNALMTAGSWDEIIKFLNREPSITVEIAGVTADGLNAGEVWLSGLMGPGTLEWLPPGQTVWTVFDLTQSYIKRSEDEGWDLDEPRWVRRYIISMKALPFARSPELTVTPAQPPAATPLVDVLINDGSSATNWTAAWNESYPFTNNGAITPSVSSGAVRATRTTANRGPNRVRLTYAIGSAIPIATPYVRVDYRIFQGTLTDGIAESSTGVSTGVPIATQTLGTPSAGVQPGTAYFAVPTDTVIFSVRGLVPENQTNAYIEVDQLRRVSRLPGAGSNRQKLAGIYPGGSAPAEGSLHVSHATAGLGKVMVYTYPLGRPSPALMQYRTSSVAPVADSSAINSQLIPITATLCDLTIPDAQLPTHGRAALWVKAHVTTSPVTLTYTIFPQSNGQIVGQTQTATRTIGTGIQIVPLGLVMLPNAVIGTAGNVLVRLEKGGSGSLSVDEVWACGMDDESALTVIEAGSGTPVQGGASNHLWINAPSALRPAGEVLIGTGPADARWPSTIMAGPQVHKFPAGGVSVMTVTEGASDASTDFTHFMRWTHHAAKAS